jgi:hypothetical protein
MEECARKIGVEFLGLVSVYSTRRLSAKYGFEVANGSDLNTKLRSYGMTAKYMIRTEIALDFVAPAQVRHVFRRCLDDHARSCIPEHALLRL